MHSRFDLFRTTPLGRQLEALITAPHRYTEYAALSRAEVPAVAALVHELQTSFPQVAHDQAARQFCGAAVAEVMRSRNHEILRPRGRVPGGFFSYGAVWTPFPRATALPEVMGGLRRSPDLIANAAAALPEEFWRRRPEGGGFSVVEHFCHLRDLDVVNLDRIDLALREDLAKLASVDGVKLAVERAYLAQDPRSALSAFRGARERLLQRLEALAPADLERIVVFAEAGQVSLREMIIGFLHHDLEHIQELHELPAELGVSAASAAPRP